MAGSVSRVDAPPLCVAIGDETEIYGGLAIDMALDFTIDACANEYVAFGFFGQSFVCKWYIGIDG